MRQVQLHGILVLRLTQVIEILAIVIVTTSADTFTVIEHGVVPPFTATERRVVPAKEHSVL